MDWPASLFWRELSQANPAALVLLSVRDTAEVWRRSVEEMILPHARLALAPGWHEGRGLLTLLERFTGTEAWDDPAMLMAAYEQYSAEGHVFPEDFAVRYQSAIEFVMRASPSEMAKTAVGRER